MNGRLSVEFLCLPANLEELVCGHLFALGSSAAQLTWSSSPSAAAQPMWNCAAGLQAAPQQKLFLQVQDLFQAMDWFAGRSELFAATGAVHSCALWHQDGRRIFMEDIGRHNAVDKALGRALWLTGIWRSVLCSPAAASPVTWWRRRCTPGCR